MRLYLRASVAAPSQYLTKDGQVIDIQVHEKLDENPNSAWTLDEFKALVGGVEVGYLRASYITPQDYARKNPTVWHYLDHHQGWSFRDVDNPDDVWAQARLNIFHDSNAWNKIPEPLKRDADLARWAERFEPLVKDFKEFFLDKPLVDMVRVGGRQDEHLEWQRQGIALAMYEFAGRWYTQRGMALYNGSLNDNSKGVWEYMKAHPERFPVKTENHPKASPGYPKVRMRLDYR
jgi:hypothetical protein